VIVLSGFGSSWHGDCYSLPETVKNKSERRQKMSEQIIELTDTDFGAQIEKGVTLVDFWAPWCGPCRMQSPILDQVAQKRQGRAKVAKVNVDESPTVVAAQAVQSIPTLIVFKDGLPVQRFVGVRPEADLLDAIDQAQN